MRSPVAVILGTLLLVALLTSGLCGCSGEGQGSGFLVVQLLNNTFQPQSLVIAGPGRAVQFRNDDDRIHTVVSDPANLVPGGPNSALAYPAGIPAGAIYTWVPPAAAPSTTWFYHDADFGAAGDGTDFGTGMAGGAILL